MPAPKYSEPLVKTAVSITERQQEAMEKQVRTGAERSVSHIVRRALDKWLGFEKATIDPLANEQEVA